MSSGMAPLEQATRCMAILIMISVQAVFSGYQIIGKSTLNTGVSPISFALQRELGATVVLVAIALCRERLDAWPRWEHRWGFLNVGACMFCNVFGMLAGLSLTTPATVAVLQPTQPVFACLLAWWVGQEQMSAPKLVGILLSCFGSAVISISTKGFGNGVDSGSLIILLQCVAGSNMIVQQRPLLELGYSPLIMTTSIYAIATAITFMLGIAMVMIGHAVEMDYHIVWWDTSTSFVVAVTYSILLGTVYNYVAIAWCRQYLNATTVTLFMLLQAIITSALGKMIYDDDVYAGQAVGAGAILCGLSVVLLRPAAQDAERREGKDSGDAKETVGLKDEARECGSVVGCSQQLAKLS